MTDHISLSEYQRRKLSIFLGLARLMRALGLLAVALVITSCAAMSEPAPSRIQGPPTAAQAQDQASPPWWLVALIVIL